MYKAGTADYVLGESFRNGAGVGNWSLLLRGEFLVYIERVVIHHKGHQHRQELCDQLSFLRGMEEQREKKNTFINQFMPPNGLRVL